MTRRPAKYWQCKENRIKATKTLVTKLKKSLSAINHKDFKENGLRELILAIGGYQNALIEAGFNVIKKKRFSSAYWTKQVNRIKETKKLIKMLGKHPSKITQEDFFNNGLNGLIRVTNKGTAGL